MDGYSDASCYIREESIRLIYEGGSGHTGGSLSVADILSVLYGKFDTMANKIILSKGHSAPALYAAMKYYKRISYGDEKLRGFGSRLQGHPSVNHLRDVVTPTGSLGQGVSVAVGIAIGMQRAGQGKTFCIVGDGEIQEGIVWESLMIAGNKRLSPFTVILDYNGLQGDGFTKDVAPLCKVADKASAFGFFLHEIDGHDTSKIDRVLSLRTNRPQFIVAHTTKGKGVSWMENKVEWHGSVTLTKEQYESAVKEINNGCESSF